MMKKLFGTDGIRGKAGDYPINGAIAYSCGYSFAEMTGKKKVLIGCDTRLSSGFIVSAIKQGLIDRGVDVSDAGVIPTPVLAFSVKKGDFAGGIVVTASHNPYRDNGIKFFDGNGKKLTEQEESNLEKLIISNGNLKSDINTNIKTADFVDSAFVKLYTDNLLKKIDVNYLNNFYQLDCANGAASYFVQKVNTLYKLNIKAINIEPTGENINDKCGAAALSHIKNNTVALDGDGDRIILKDSSGNVINGDIILMFLASCLNVSGIVGTVMTNQAVATFCKTKGLKFFRTDVGDKFVRSKMDEEHIDLGGETSGHIIADSLNFTGDGFAVYLKLTELLNKNCLTLDDLTANFPLYPQKLINVTVKEKLPFAEIKGFGKMISNVETMLKEDGGRIFPRYSGTENYLRILLETKSKTVLNKAEKVISDFFKTLEEK
jgi:phosphoglucosamine mutase